MKKRRPTKERPVMACLLQPHIDLYSRFELNHVPVIVNGDPLDQPSDQSVVILRHLPAYLSHHFFQFRERSVVETVPLTASLWYLMVTAILSPLEELRGIEYKK